MSIVLRLKVKQKLEYRYFLKKTVQQSLSDTLKTVLTTSSQNFHKVFWKLFDLNHRALEKISPFEKDFESKKSSSRNAKCNFGNPAGSLSKEVRKNCGPIPKLNISLFLSWKKQTSKRCSMEFECSVENDDPILWKKSKYICSKFEKVSDPKIFLEPHPQTVPLDTLKGIRTKLRENCCQKSDNFSVKVRKEV